MNFQNNVNRSRSKSRTFRHIMPEGSDTHRLTSPKARELHGLLRVGLVFLSRSWQSRRVGQKKTLMNQKVGSISKNSEAQIRVCARRGLFDIEFCGLRRCRKPIRAEVIEWNHPELNLRRWIAVKLLGVLLGARNFDMRVASQVMYVSKLKSTGLDCS